MAKVLEDDAKLGLKPDPGLIEWEPSLRWVRTKVGGLTIADSKRVMLMRQPFRPPVYYFPRADVRMDLLNGNGRTSEEEYKGEASYWNINSGETVVDNAAWTYEKPLPNGIDASSHIAFYWSKMDSWWEEDDEVFVHPRDPYSRVDVVHSSREVRVVIGGQTVADTRRPRLLFETHLPTRYYIPKADVRTELLSRSDTVTRCPYKGIATHWSVRANGEELKDMAWSYESPIAEIPKLEGLVSFYNERVDELYVDGELQPKPETPWSRRPG